MQVMCHEAYAITPVGDGVVVCMDGQFCIYNSMQVAAHNLGVIAKNNPELKFTIREFDMLLPWTEKDS